MAPGMDEDRLLAEIERSLAREDPALDERMSALGSQFTGEPPDDAATGSGRKKRRTGGKAAREEGRAKGYRDWRKIVAIVAVVVAVVGMILTAVLMRPVESGPDQIPPTGMPPAASAVLHPGTSA
nr:DUF3040 domain-containing protein [Streptomyces sp. TRM64462]